MDLIFGIGNVVIGVFISLIGFKIYNPFKGKNEIEKEEQFYNKFGKFFKFGGIVILIIGIMNTIGNL